MENTMVRTLKSLQEQIMAGLNPQAIVSASPSNHSVVEKPIKVGDLFARSDAARDDLRHTGYAR